MAITSQNRRSRKEKKATIITALWMGSYISIWKNSYANRNIFNNDVNLCRLFIVSVRIVCEPSLLRLVEKIETNDKWKHSRKAETVLMYIRVWPRAWFMVSMCLTFPIPKRRSIISKLIYTFGACALTTLFYFVFRSPRRIFISFWRAMRRRCCSVIKRMEKVSVNGKYNINIE